MLSSLAGFASRVDTEAVLPLIERYFSRVPSGPKPPALRTVEPPQIGEKTVVLEDPSQPVYVEGYHKPAQTHPDQPVWDVIDDVLSNGRTSRLYRSLVRDKKIAAQAGSFSSFPGSKYPTLWIAFAIPSPESSNEEVRDAIRAEIERLKSEDLSEEDLARAKTRAKAGLLRSLRNNFGLANNIAQWHTLFGDWRELFRYIDRIEAVTAADVSRIGTPRGTGCMKISVHPEYSIRFSAASNGVKSRSPLPGSCSNSCSFGSFLWQPMPCCQA